MSLRESRLCDYPRSPDAAALCSSPAVSRCPFCCKDCCDFHVGRATILSVLVYNTGTMREGLPHVAQIGAGDSIQICSKCSDMLMTNVHSQSVGLSGIDLAFNDVAAKLDDQIVPAVQAFFASEAMKKT